MVPLGLSTVRAQLMFYLIQLLGHCQSSELEAKVLIEEVSPEMPLSW